MEYLSVSKVANLLGKHEETIKRWIRTGKFPNAQKENDKLGWKIPQCGIEDLSKNKYTMKNFTSKSPSLPSGEISQQDIKELVNLAYQAVTMSSPTDEMLGYLSYVGIKRTLEILLTMQQSPTKVKNPEGFIKKAITKGWTPMTFPIKKERNVARIHRNSPTPIQAPPPFYNWLDD
jgi:hypothetical protein